MLRHIRQQQLYWFCRTCWQEMPSLEGKLTRSLSYSLPAELKISSRKRALVTV